MPDGIHLDTVVGRYPQTAALWTGESRSDLVTLDLTEVEPIHKVFAPMVRKGAHELCEVAIVTALQAIAYDRPIVLLPAVIAGRQQRGCIITRRDGDISRPEDLRGRRIGVRAWTQTTGIWVRAALWEDFGIGMRDATWITRDPAHVAEYRDPDGVLHDETGKSLPEQLRDGDIDAAILGNDLPPGDEFAKVIPDHAERDRDWVKRHGFVPVNHIVVVRRDVIDEKPEAVRAAYDLLKDAASRAKRPPEVPDPTLFGLEPFGSALRFIIAECERQSLLPRRLDPDSLLQPAAALLGQMA